MIDWEKVIQFLPSYTKSRYMKMTLAEKYTFLKGTIETFEDYDKEVKKLCKFLEY